MRSCVVPGTSRLRPPHAANTVLHWSSWSGAPGPVHVAPLVDALAQAVRGQRPRAAVATVDSVLHHGLLTREQVAGVFATLPARFAPLLALVDPSAASGPETFLRLILRSAGLDFETQVWIAGVGYVDFLIEGWLIVECDSREFHGGWDAQARDRQRDATAATQGYVTLRLLGADILRGDPDVRRTLLDVRGALGPMLRPRPHTTPRIRRRSARDGSD